MTTLCPTCGYPRETFASDEGTSGFMPYKPVDSSQPIDIDEVIRKMVWEIQEGFPIPDRDIYFKHLNALCARVEAQTAKNIMGDMAFMYQPIYAPAALGKGETK